MTDPIAPVAQQQIPRARIPGGAAVLVTLIGLALAACAQPHHHGPALSVSQVHTFCESLTEGQSLAALQFPFGSVQSLPETGEVAILPEPRRAGCVCLLVLRSGVLVSRTNQCPL